MARQFVAHGVRKIRLTGGEPLLRKNIEVLVEQLAALRTRRRRAAGPHPDHQRLAAGAQGQGAEGRRACSASPSAWTAWTTRCSASMNDVDFPVAEVLEGIDAARDAGPGPDQGQHGGQARHQRARDPADGAPLQGHRHRAALHRVHGRGRHQRLAHGRGDALGRSREAGRRANCRWSSWSRARPAKPPSAGATPTAAARSASSAA